MKSEKKRARLQNLPNDESVVIDVAVIAVVVAVNAKFDIRNEMIKNFVYRVYSFRLASVKLHSPKVHFFRFCLQVL